MFREIGNTLEEMLNGVEISNDLLGVIGEILNSVTHAMGELGGYDALMERILSGQGLWSPHVERIMSNQGLWGPHVLPTPYHHINIIPSDGPGMCHEILLAFAQGRRSPRVGLGITMRKVREHLIRCGNSPCMRGEQTRVAIIFTDLWDKKIFSESIGDIKAHRETPPGKLIFGVLVGQGNSAVMQIV